MDGIAATLAALRASEGAGVPSLRKTDALQIFLKIYVAGIALLSGIMYNTIHIQIVL